jgi:tripartite-type tricarboxylate transporter receptor subunit TctC
MKLPRRKFLHLGAGAAALPAVSRVAFAQAYPSRPVRIIVAAAAGGPTDIIARLFGQWFSDRMGQRFIVENRAGGSNNIGTEAVVRSPADGYTLLLVNAVNAINATLFDKLSYDFLRDIAPVAGIARVPNVMEVHPSLPVTTVPEFIAYAKANPGKVNFGSAGSGTSGHISCELFKMMTDVNMVHVPYRGSAPMLTDLLGGQVQVTIDNVAGSIDHIRTGRLRALAVTTATRWEGLPDTPTVGDFLPGFEASGWYGIGTPSKTPAEIVERLNIETNSALADPKIKARLSDLGFAVLAGSSSDFGRLVAEETEKWGKVIRAANIKPE